MKIKIQNPSLVSMGLGICGDRSSFNEAMRERSFLLFGGLHF
jgi:hypothetical protein